MKHSLSIAIRLINIGKRYEIHHEKPTLVEKFIRSKNEIFWALKNVSLILLKGEKVGIIGPNGSGKTTLLKIISGITAPSTGIVKAYGKIVSLIDLEAGFHPDLSGYQNIFLNGMIVGMDKKEIEKKLLSIIQFADIHQFIDVPLYTYSSGMKIRLGFSIAVHCEPDILLLDEGMNVGDERFRLKSYQKIQLLIQKGSTIVSASHNLDHIRQKFERIILLQDGRISQDSNKTVVSYYRDLSHQRIPKVL